MKAKLYTQKEDVLAGMTLKSITAPEHNNMALHSCDNAQHVVGNRQKLATFLDCDLNDFICAEQTHSANFKRVTSLDKGKGASRLDSAIPDTDALYTYEANLLLCSFSADCVPVLFYNEVAGLVGIIHSGWQGTVKEITLKLFNHLSHIEKCNPSDFHVHIGAAISQEKFEVDEDVHVKFKSLGYADEFVYYNEATSKYHIDNQQTVKKQCELAGIPANQINIDRMCTFQSPDGFSYRQNKRCGRHLSFIMRMTVS